MRRSAALLALALATMANAQYPGALPPPEGFRKGFASIREADAKAILGYLAGPECEGRGTGQPGFQKAAEFMAARFRAAGLKPLGDDGTYFQNATFYRPSVSEARMTLPSGATLGEESVALNPVGRDLDVSGEVVFVRASAPLTDDQTRDLQGKIVLTDLPTGRAGRQLQSQILRANPKAVLAVVDGVRPLVPRASMQRPREGATLRVTGQVARDVLAKLSIAPPAGPAEAALLHATGTARIAAKGSIAEVKVPNVVGMVEGSDPTLRAETVGVGGHLDHLGVNADGVVYPGADDDGSGSTAVALIAQAVAANPVKPRRSVIFMTFFGEEMGLLGSRFLTEHPPVPLDRMVAELQMDMVGRDSDGVQNGDPGRVDKRAENVDTIRLVGSKRISTDLDKAIQAQNRYVGFRFKYDAEDVYTRSDHYNFAAKGIPIAFLFDGFHPDYHQPTDTIEKIDWNKLTNAARLYYLTLMKVANDPAAPVKDVKG